MVDAGAEPTYAEKIRVPPWDVNWSNSVSKNSLIFENSCKAVETQKINGTWRHKNLQVVVMTMILSKLS